jgi:poly(3-hydroxybutyrate) depolymerase
MHPGDDVESVPMGWGRILDRRHLLFIAPLHAGNNYDTSRRLGLAVLAAEEMVRHYRIDPRRIYASGWSGGARIAGMLGFYQPDLFHGTIQSCGADFYAHVEDVFGKSGVDTHGNSYGIFDATQSETNEAKTVSFVLITGSNDFRRGNILDIYKGGLAKFGFRARLFDVPSMGHSTADAMTFDAALNFIEIAQ